MTTDGSSGAAERPLRDTDTLRRSHELLEALSAAQSEFITDRDPGPLFDRLLEALLDLTRSEYGFIGEVLSNDKGEPYLKTHAITNIAWNTETRAFYDRYAATGMEFSNLRTLFGAVMTSGEPVIANEPATDPRRGGLPEGHPEMRAFCGLPFYSGDQLVGMVGIANRPGGYDLELVEFLRPFLGTCGTIVSAYRNRVQARRVEEQLKESEARLRSIFDTATEGIVSIDEQGTIESVNAAALKLFGYKDDELVGRNVAMLMPSPHQEQHQGYIDRYLKTGNAKIIGIGREVEGLRKDGTAFPLFLSISEVEAGPRRRFTGILLDITQVKQTEEALRQLNERLEQRVDERTKALQSTNRALEREIAERMRAETRSRSLFERSPLMDIVTRNEAGIPVIEDCNVAFLETLGYARDEIVGRPLTDFYAPPSREEALTGGYERALAGKFTESERQLLTRDGRVIETLLRTVPETDGSGKVVGTRAMYLDVTARTRAEEAMRDAEEARRARELAERASRAKSDFLATVSHELRTPLNVISGMVELLGDTELQPQQLDFVRSLRNNSESLLRLIEDLLDVAKIEEQRLELVRGAFDIVDFIDGIRSALLRRAEAQGLQLTSRVEAAAARVLVGDAERLRQVLLNLVGNGIKFTQEGQVEVAAEVELQEPARARVRFEVRDTGVGISPEAQATIFERFSQAGSSASQRSGGLGLGLYISQELVSRMGGEIKVESTPGSGSRFFFELLLPVAEEEETREPAMTEAAPIEAAGSGLRVLLVEDNDDNRRLVTRLLEGAGCVVESATGGAEGVAKAQAGRFDLCFMDVDMPDVDGLEAARRIRAWEEREGRDPTIIVALTAHAIKGYRERCLEAGMNDYLTKPVKRSELVATLEKWIPARPALLVADDSRDSRLLARKFLEAGLSCVVVEASDGNEALELAANQDFALILLDMEMPSMNGFDACARLRATGFERPIVAVTGHTRKKEVLRCHEAGGDLVLRKPYSRQELLKTVSTLLARGAERGAPLDPEAIEVPVDADLEDLVPGFIANRKADAARLKDHLEAGDFESARRLGHDLKGVGQPYGFEVISRLGHKIERAAEAEDGVELDKLAAGLEDYLSRIRVVVSSSAG